jgi:Tfp pilus assembly protein PilO
MQWGEGSAIEEALSTVDCDIAAALGHAKEELRQEGEAKSQAVNVLQQLRRVLESVEEEVERWGGDNPFERSLDALDGIET